MRIVSRAGEELVTDALGVVNFHAWGCNGCTLAAIDSGPGTVFWKGNGNGGWSGRCGWCRKMLCCLESEEALEEAEALEAELNGMVEYLVGQVSLGVPRIKLNC